MPVVSRSEATHCSLLKEELYQETVSHGSETQRFYSYELMVVAIIVIASLLNARKSGRDAKGISTLRSIATSQDIYRWGFGAYASGFGEPGSIGIISQLQTGGNVFPQYDSVAYGVGRIWWSMAANPVDWGITGDRSFCSNLSGGVGWAQ